MNAPSLKSKISLPPSWKDGLQNWITASLFALCMLFFLFLLGGEKDLFMVPYFFPLALFCLIFGLIFNRFKLFLGVCLVFMGILLFQIFFKIDLQLPFLSLSFWHNFGENLKSCLNWLLLPEEAGMAKPAFFNLYAFVLLSILSVLTIWFLPIPLLNMFFLIQPL